jgi:hypothetical protein
MTMGDIIRGGELLQEIVKILNEICKVDGGIEADDECIWDHWLHQRCNQDWLDIYAALDALYGESPGSFYAADSTVFERAKTALARCMAKDKDFVGKPKVKTSGCKNDVWQTIMRVREVINRYRGETVPNRPPSKYGTPKSKPSPLFNDIFTTQ